MGEAVVALANAPRLELGQKLLQYMARDIFEFWSTVKPGEKTHPEDREILARITHHFELDCLPGTMTGPLKNASIVCLGLAPGWTPDDPIDATRPASIARNARMRTGLEPLMGPSGDKLPWWYRKTRKWDIPLGDLQTRLAFLNIAPYKSPGTFRDYKALKVLPSCRVALEWANEVLFPEARLGKRVVICLRSPERWGLQRGTKNGMLYAPEITRGADMFHGPMRDEIIKVVGERIAQDKAKDEA